LRVKFFLLSCCPFIVTAVMLTVIQPPFELSLLAWVALVPFILVCSPAAKLSHLAILAYIVSLIYWLGNLYWMAPVTALGWAAFCLYTALLWPILLIALRYCRKRNWPLFIAVPILVVGAERLQGLFLGGFFWRLLSHSQYANITFIQIADIFGAAGISFLIAMVNGLLAELLIAAGQKNILRVRYFLHTALVLTALAGTIVYGRWRISQAEKFIETGPLVASVQSNVPQSVKESLQADDEIFDSLLQQSRQSAEAGAELIVWPETMVQAILNESVWPFMVSSQRSRAFDKALKEHSNNTAFVLVGSPGGEIKWENDGTVSLARYNSAFLYTPDGSQAKEQYNKVHLVPFGEVVPFRKSIPWLYNLLMSFTPYDYEYSLDYGTKYTVFEIAGKDKSIYRFGVMICYEDAVPAIARKFAVDRQGQKKLDWLVNISNDGWFVRFNSGIVCPTTELAQHAAICAFRAVENRLAVLRSVNTGISCLVDTQGQIKNGFLAGNLPNNAMERKGVAGWLADTVPIDKRVTFFSRYGQWLDFCCALCLVLLIIVPPLGRFFSKRTKKIKG